LCRLIGILEYFYKKRIQPVKFMRLFKAVVHEGDDVKEMLSHSGVITHFVKAVTALYEESNDPENVCYYQYEMVPCLRDILKRLGMEGPDDLKNHCIDDVTANGVYQLISKF
jgi:hypothetical protein